MDMRRAEAQKILMKDSSENGVGNGDTGSNKRHLDRARRRQDNDEFYTSREDVEKELSQYSPKLFKGKTVFCNCDDPTWSEFFRYFVVSREHLGLKEVITTHYEPLGTPSYALRYNGKIGKLTDHQFLEAVKAKKSLPKFKFPLKGNGDFMSEECTALLKEADIVVTNPPFSLFRPYFKQLMDHGKKFIILGNMNAAWYKAIRGYVANGSVWLGAHNGAKKFRKPDGGIQSMGNVVWFTNLEHERRENEFIPLYKSWSRNKDEYVRYENFDAIEIPKTADIPEGYDGKMGVPISFLTKHNPKQFDMLGFARDLQRKDLKLRGGGGEICTHNHSAPAGWSCVKWGTRMQHSIRRGMSRKTSSTRSERTWKRSSATIRSISKGRSFSAIVTTLCGANSFATLF